MLIRTQSGKLITATVGSGDNLSREDIEDGFIGYLNTNLYELDEYEIVEKDGGELLMSVSADELTEKEIVYRLLDYWGEVGLSTVLEPLY